MLWAVSGLACTLLHIVMTIYPCQGAGENPEQGPLAIAAERENSLEHTEPHRENQEEGSGLG